MGNRSEKPRVNERRARGLTRKTVKLIIILAALGALVFVSLGIQRDRTAPPPADPPPVNVTTMTVTAVPQLPDTFELPAVVEPNRIVQISAEVDGRVEWIGPRKGAQVQTGAPLIRLNTDLLGAQLQMAEAQARNSQTEFDRIRGLVERGAAPSRDLDAATTQLAVHRSQLEQVRTRLARARIVAPIAGVLNNLMVEEGEYVAATPPTAVAQIVDTSVVKVATEVPERDIPFLAVGERAEVLADVKGRRVALTGTITFISKLANLRTRSTPVEITLANEEGLVRTGQIVQVRLTRQVLQDAVLIPLLAVIPMEVGRAVYVVEFPENQEPPAAQGRAERREVELGIIRGDRVQIRSGLQPGDRLIVAGHRFVAPGQEVLIVSESQ
ncbi:MAG: efflux RND transporter periplasmic adaptor subunit [Planctomycetes bacterium]|nr:efflux RND transporter periplasmic adaptor subunit [Planctomycetota bacterium]